MSRLHRLLYLSRPAQGLASNDVGRILETSRVNNRAAGLTGFLAFGTQAFLQVLEGPAGAVSSCFGRIVADTRHRDVQLIAYEPIDAHGFPDWGMGYTALHTRHAALVSRYCAGGRISLDTVTPRGALLLLEELSAEVMTPPPARVPPTVAGALSASSTRLPVA